MTPYRPEGALLAGVCAELAGRLGWNVWAIRALFALGLLIKTLWVGAAYVALACLLGWLGKSASRAPELVTPELKERGRRIADLEKRFSELE